MLTCESMTTSMKGLRSKKAGFKQHDTSVVLKGNYTSDDFTNNVRLWEKYVLPNLVRSMKKSRDQTMNILLVGSANQGITIEFLVTHPVLLGFTKRILVLTDNQDKHLVANVKMYGDGVEIVERDVETTMLGLTQHQLTNEKEGNWDLVFVEGFDAAKILRVGLLSFLSTKPGGLLVFDDYTMSREHDTACPRRGVDALVDTHSRFLKTIGPSGWQAIFMKRVRPLGKLTCKSEYYSD